jgi:hypothetical protein
LLSYYTFKLVFDVLFAGFGVLFDTLKKYSPTVTGIFNPSFIKIKNLFGNLFEKNDEQVNEKVVGDNDEDPFDINLRGGSANVLKVSKEQFAKLVNKISKSSVSGFKKLFELSKLIKLDANGQKAKKLFEVLASKRNMAIITGSLFAISYAISYLLKKSAKKIEKKFDKETELTKEDMKKIKDNLDKKLQKIKEAENLKNQIKTLVKN